MRPMFNKGYYWLVVLFCATACDLPSGVIIGPFGDDGKECIELNFQNLSLKYNFGEKFNTAWIDADYGEFIAYHGLLYNENYSGAITSLDKILWGEENYDTEHKPSITVTIVDLFNRDTTHSCKKGDIVQNTVYGIPKIDDFSKGTIEIKSIKTRAVSGIQVIWKKTVGYDSWPINEFVADGTYKYDLPGITKVGTNNDSGNVAMRDDSIIPNTCIHDIASDRLIVQKEERQLISPDLRKPILSGGGISNELKWSEPTICKVKKL